MCRRVQGSQIFKQNWIISIRSRVIVILLILVSLALGWVGQVGGGCPEWSIIVYMSSEMLRGKESSNRIELSRLVHNLLNFVVMGSLQLWGGGRWVWGVWGHLEALGVSPHACMHTHTHVYMYRNCKWPPTWRHPCLACLTCMCMHACMHVHACLHGTLPHPYRPHPHPLICHPWGPPESVKIQ